MRNERDLAEPRRAVIGGDERLQHRLAVIGAHPYDAAILERQRESFDERAAVAERLGAAYRSVHTPAIGQGEHFLGRDVGGERDALPAGRSRAEPDVTVRQTDREIGAGTAIPQ